jgi:hypothetical protein
MTDIPKFDGTRWGMAVPEITPELLARPDIEKRPYKAHTLYRVPYWENGEPSKFSGLWLFVCPSPPAVGFIPVWAEFPSDFKCELAWEKLCELIECLETERDGVNLRALKALSEAVAEAEANNGERVMVKFNKQGAQP